MMRSTSIPSAHSNSTPLQSSTGYFPYKDGLSSGLSRHRGTSKGKSSLDSSNNNHHYNGPVNIQDHHAYQVVDPTTSNGYEMSAIANPIDSISSTHGSSSRHPPQKRHSPSFDSTTQPIQHTFDGTVAAASSTPAYDTSAQITARLMQNGAANHAIASSHPHPCSRSLTVYGYTNNPVLGPTAVQEKVPIRKTSSTAPYMGGKVNSNMTRKDSYSTQIYKDTVNENAGPQKVNSFGGSAANLGRHWSYDFKVPHGESTSKRASLCRQTAFDMAPNVLQHSALDSMNRGYAAKSTMASFSTGSVNAGYNSFTSSVNGEYGAARAQTGLMNQSYGSNYELSIAAVPRKISNEYCGNSQRVSDEKMISAQEFMKRLLQAHQVVDELLKSRGLIPEDELEYLRNWRQRTEREPKIEEEQSAVSADVAAPEHIGNKDGSETSRQRRTSNASDSGLSMDADSENDLRSSPQLQGLNAQKCTDEKLLPSKKQEELPTESIQVDVTKVKKHKNVRIKVIIRKPQRCSLYVDAKLRFQKEKIVIKITSDSDSAQNLKNNFDKGQQKMAAQTRRVENKSATHTVTKSEEGNASTSIQNNIQGNDQKMPKALTALERSVTEAIQESIIAKLNTPEADKKRDKFIARSKCETVNGCFHFVNELLASEKAIICLCANNEYKGTAITAKQVSQKIKNEKKSTRHDDDHALRALLLTAAGKLPLFSRKFSTTYQELQTSQGWREVIEIPTELEKAEDKQEGITETTKEVITMKKTKKSPKDMTKSQENIKSSAVPKTKNVTAVQTKKVSTNSKQLLGMITVSKDLHHSSKLQSQQEAVITIPLRSQEMKIAQRLVVKKTVRKKGCKHEELLATSNLSLMKRKEPSDMKKTRKIQQGYTIVTPKYYQKTLRSTSGNASSALPEVDRNADTDIRRAREHLRRIDFSRLGGKLESRASFVHQITEDPMKLSHAIVTSRETSTERSSSVSSVMKKTKKKVRGTKVEKGSKDRPASARITSTGKGRHGGGAVAERANDVLERKLINEYRRTQRIPKPQAKIPAWNIYDERKHATTTIGNPPKLRNGNLAPVLPTPRFIRARTPVPIDVTTNNPSTSVSHTALLRHITSNQLPVKTSPSKNINLSKGSTNVGTVDGLQQQSPSSCFGVMLKRVDRAAVQKSKRRGAITESAPKKPWVPKWRRIQRSEEEQEAEVISSAETTKNKFGGGDDEQEEKQMSTRLSSRRPSQTEKDEKDMTEAEKAMLDAKRRQEEEEVAKLQEYEEKRRVEREREEEELRKLKEKKERRKLEREEEERQFQERLRQEEERRKQEEEERKAKLEAEKRKKEEEKRKRQQMLSSQFTSTTAGQTGRNFVIPQKSDRADKFGNIVQAKQEMGMTKEQQEEAKRNYLASVKRTIEFVKAAPAELREKIRQLHQRICKLEADKYDLEKRHERQEYDLRELNERQRQVARNKALKKGLDPADTNSRHPPKVSIVSKYDRQIDRRNFKERRAVFENKNAYPCFPNVPPPPAVYEKVILSEDKENEPEDEDEDEEAAEQADEGGEEEETVDDEEEEE